MKNKLILLIVLLATLIPLLSVSNYACEFLFINPSARDAAFGLESGVASLRNLSPASIANNPAKLGAYQGVGFEYSTYDYIFGNYNTSNLVYGKNGFGISVPIINNEGKFGNSRIYGLQSMTDEDGYNIGSFTPRETNSTFSVGFDVTRELRNFNIDFGPNSSDSKLSMFVGYSLHLINSALSDVSFGQTEVKPNKDGNFSDIGILGSYKFRGFAASPHSYELTLGLNVINVFGSDMHYVNRQNGDPFPQAFKFGATAAYYLALPWLQQNNPNLYKPYFSSITRRALVIYGSIDHAAYNNERSVTGFGMEASLLDIISARIGHTMNHETELSGTSYSFGFKLNYLDKYKLMVDYLDMFNDSEIYSPEKWNFSVAYKF